MCELQCSELRERPEFRRDRAGQVILIEKQPVRVRYSPDTQSSGEVRAYAGPTGHPQLS